MRFRTLCIVLPLVGGLVACQDRTNQNMTNQDMASQDGTSDVTSTTPDLTGEWRLVSWHLISPNGETTYPFGETPEGQIIYTGTGEMSAHLMYPGAEPGDLSGLDATEIFARVSRTYIAYYGTYTVDAAAGTVTHHVRGSLRQSWVGTDQVREFEMIGDDRLSLTANTPRNTEFSTNYAGANVLVWERIQ